MAGRILIADSVATNRIILKVKLASARYEIVQAARADEALALARSARPDLVILDAQLAGGDAVETCARLKADPLTRATPVLVLDAHPSRASRLAALRAGADDVLAKPVDDAAFLALVRNLMRTRATFDELARRQETSGALGFAEAASHFSRAARVAVIAPRAQSGLVWRKSLGFALGARVETMVPSQALDPIAAEDAPDAWVLAADAHRPGEGLRLVSELRSRPAGRQAVIVIVDEASDPAVPPMALDIGANAVTSGPFDPEELAARLTVLLARKLELDALRESFDERLSLVTRDPLTGLYNRRYADTYLRRVSQEASRSGQPFALMLLDLDRFKNVNDTWGHMAGDEVLVETARRLAGNLREIDLIARYGGEEFVVAMPQTGLAEAHAAAERLRRRIGEQPMHSPSSGQDIAVTVSIGVAICPPGKIAPEALPQALLQQADAALYASKNEGRNQVTLGGGQAA